MKKNNFKKYIPVILALVTGIISLPAQSLSHVTTRHLLWGGWQEQVNFSPKWSATLDVQSRYDYGNHEWFQNLGRAGVTYTPNLFSFSAGGAYFLLYPNPDNKPPRQEWRAWEEIARKFILKKTILGLRFRTEQRYLRDYKGKELQEKFGYNSFRARLKADVNLPLFKNDAIGISFIAADEFLYAWKTGGFAAFDQNRISGGLSVSIRRGITIQVTWMDLYQSTGVNKFDDDHILRATIIHQFNLYKEK